MLYAALAALALCPSAPPNASGSIVRWDATVVVPQEELANLVAVAGGGKHSLGLKSDGSIVAWGWNDDGQCNVPAPNGDFVAVAGGYYHSLGLKSDGSIMSWGANEDFFGKHAGQCDVPAPNSDFVGVAGGGFYSLALRSLFGDVNVDGGVDLADFDVFVNCLPGPAVLLPRGCNLSRMDGDWDVDLADFARFQRSFGSP